MTARTGDVIAQAARAVAAHMWDRDTAEAPTWGALTPSEQDAVIENEQTAGIARALADAGLLRQETPTRDEIARAMEEKHRVEPLGDADHHHGCVCGGWDDSWDCVETWDEHYAAAVLALWEGRKR